jgi:integrase
MAKAKLTVRSLETIVKAQTDKALYVWDTELNGFGAYISTGGDVSWLVQKWIGGRGGKAVRQVIGKTKQGMELPEARSLATSSIGDIHKGIDLLGVKQKRRQAVRDDIASISVKDALDRFHKKFPSDGSRYRTERETNLRTALSGYEKTKLKALSKADVRVVMETKKTEASQRNLFAALRPFFNYFVEQDLITVSPLSGITPAKPVDSRDRQLSKPEVKALWLASYHMPDRWGSFYRLLLLTGQRREEVAGMHCQEIDFDQHIWTIPKERSKNGKAHIVQLTPMALQEIGQAQGYVFPPASLRIGEKSPGYISGFSKMKTKLDKQMAIELEKVGLPFSDWRVHDLRRTMASGLAERGISTDVVDRLLNHVSGSQSGVKGVYQRYSFLKERGEALSVWADIVTSLCLPAQEQPATLA